MFLFRLFQGHDTTAAAINFTCFMIASHPEVQQKLHEEIDRVFGTDHDRPSTIEDLNELNYLECVIKETLRLYPSVPFIAREVQEDFEYSNIHVNLFSNIPSIFCLGGFKVLRGSSAAIFIYYIHRDPKHFSNPDRFDPDRFLPENSVDRPPYAFIPFSAGSRNCIGQRFAMLEEKVMLSWILRRFRLKTSQTPDELNLSFEVILRSEHGAFVALENRE
jgi:cytochrome P450 family 4 subfamily V